MRFHFEEPPNRRLPSLRRWLITIHTDLLDVHRWIDKYVWPDDLLLVEEYVLVLEDRRFFDHTGIDLKGALREAFKALALRRHGGASTIDMQFVRTVTGYREKTLKRKLYEYLLARTIQYRYSKIEILRAYLKCAFFGSHLTGVNQASWQVYEKPTNELSHQEASTLASFLVYPKPLSPTPRWREKVDRRSQYAQMLYPRFKKKLEKSQRREFR